MGDSFRSEGAGTTRSFPGDLAKTLPSHEPDAPAGAGGRTARMTKSPAEVWCLEARSPPRALDAATSLSAPKRASLEAAAPASHVDPEDGGGSKEEEEGGGGAYYYYMDPDGQTYYYYAPLEGTTTTTPAIGLESPEDPAEVAPPRRETTVAGSHEEEMMAMSSGRSLPITQPTHVPDEVEETEEAAEVRDTAPPPLSLEPAPPPRRKGLLGAFVHAFLPKRLHRSAAAREAEARLARRNSPTYVTASEASEVREDVPSVASSAPEVVAGPVQKRRERQRLKSLVAEETAEREAVKKTYRAALREVTREHARLLKQHAAEAKRSSSRARPIPLGEGAPKGKEEAHTEGNDERIVEMQQCRILRVFWKTKIDPNAPKTIAKIPQKKPYMVSLEKGKTYYWCSCGLSKKQPFCDGNHKPYNEQHGTSMKPVELKPEKSKKYLLCGCKQTGNRPYCDFSHVGVLFRTAVGIDKDPK